jgi:transcriptional regulator with XRE-family HTH domain
MAYAPRSPDPRSTAVMRAVGRGIRLNRLAQGLTQRDLEELCGLDQTTFSRLERGLAPGMSIERLAGIIAVLRINELTNLQAHRRATDPHD